MLNFEIDYPSSNYKNYIESVYEFCKNNRFSMILKGSLAKGTATKFSDIDLIILGNIDSHKVDEIISLYGNPVMINFTENPKGILILIYQDNISVDLDIREAISQQDLQNSMVLLKYDTNFIIDNKEIIRKRVESNYITNRPEWYKVLRLLHRGTIKYLSNKTDSAYDLLEEIKESLISLKITDLSFNNNFEDDIKCIFDKFYKKFKVDSQIEVLFHNLFKEF
ncbi:nucleotidyltransferase domain-containing protein [uncultured Tissierella sp.]|uniref:nucleotidyltransferase domain-containing protein n=1 Tax=uncultured Tissierella sp. TaxID=448160 RepID=UPI002803D61E|nr:nucleotidyltransferase domain-containing protein [uncultured Tissierella sp.]MDU5082997.1 nucleotidyltransferase domain-containing protein [Bacillota bacterium]